MSIFSKIKGAKKAAKDHKQAQQGAAAEQVDKPIPYKHIPTHAAIDAMAGAPASYREADRAEIMATNEKRRSMVQMNRNSSAMSNPINRNSSYGSSSNYSYSRPVPPRMEARRSYGANGGYYNNGMSNGYQTFSPSPLASKGPSPTGSLNESSSSSSSHLVEMQYAAPTSSTHLAPSPHAGPSSSPYGVASGYAPQQSISYGASGPSAYGVASPYAGQPSPSYAMPGPSSYGAATPYSAQPSSSYAMPGPSSYGHASASAPQAQKRYEPTMMETLHGNPTRKLGEAPILSQPPPSAVKPIVTPTPIAAKKRSWGFGKRNSRGPAIVAC